MDRRRWTDLPTAVQRAVETRCGPVQKDEPASAGVNNQFASTLHTEDGKPVFCKGIRLTADPWTLAMFQREAGIGHSLPDTGLAPKLLWDIEQSGWRLLGFEHITGRAADFRPGSDDLPRIAEVLRSLAKDLTPSPNGHQDQFGERLRAAQIWGTYVRDGAPDGLDRWAAQQLTELASWESRAPAYVVGNTLLHTDLNSHNWIVGSDRIRVVDWSWTAIGAAWVESEFLAPRLLDAGHSCADVQQWVSHSYAGSAPDDAARVALAIAVAGIWTHRALSGGFKPGFADAARRWAKHRLSKFAGTDGE